MYNDVQVPQYATQASSGADIYAYTPNEDIIIKSSEIKLIKTGIKVEIPEGYEIQVRPRSGLALKHGITVLNTPGTIDADYRGEIGIILANFSKQDFVVKHGMKIAQLVLQKVEQIQFQLVSELSETIRSDGGYGHTGI